MRFAWPLAITEWSVIYTQSWFTTPKLRWILSMATLSSFNPFLRHPPPLSLSLCLFLRVSLYRSVSVIYSTKTKIENAYTFHRATPLSRRLITPAWTLFHINLRAVSVRKKNYEYFRNPLSILASDWKSFQDPITMLRVRFPLNEKRGNYF